MEKGQWLHKPDQDKFEDLFAITNGAEFRCKGEEDVLGGTFLTFKLGLLAIKIRNVIELEENEAKISKFDKRLGEARSDSITARVRYEFTDVFFF